MLERIMNANKPKGSHKLTWAGFQVTTAIMFFTGLKTNEVACVEKQMILDIVEKGTMSFYQSKVNKYRVIRFTPYGVNAI